MVDAYTSHFITVKKCLHERVQSFILLSLYTTSYATFANFGLLIVPLAILFHSPSTPTCMAGLRFQSLRASQAQPSRSHRIAELGQREPAFRY